MNTGIVVIGRNEGERLAGCLESTRSAQCPAIYVDSASTDNSIAIAKSFGIDIVELDPAIQLSAARARNEGFARLIISYPTVKFVQFIDGDCELSPDWITSATKMLHERADLAIVAGHLRERSPEISIYNRLGDLEWNYSGPGEVTAVGGIFMVRREAFETVGGFDLTITAGEEPELCGRLIRQGWHLLRVEQQMAVHDLAMTRFGQWWRRQIRNGYGGLDVAKRFGLAEYKRMTNMARFWVVWPFLILIHGAAFHFFFGPVSAIIVVLATAGLWPAQLSRIAVRTWRAGEPFPVALAYAWFTMISYWPQVIGQFRFLADQYMLRSNRLIEYKVPVPCVVQKEILPERRTGGVSR